MALAPSIAPTAVVHAWTLDASAEGLEEMADPLLAALPRSASPADADAVSGSGPNNKDAGDEDDGGHEHGDDCGPLAATNVARLIREATFTSIDADEPLVESGLDSMEMCELEGELRALTGLRQLPISYVLKFATLRDLCRALRQKVAEHEAGQRVDFG